MELSGYLSDSVLWLRLGGVEASYLAACQADISLDEVAFDKLLHLCGFADDTKIEKQIVSGGWGGIKISFNDRLLTVGAGCDLEKPFGRLDDRLQVNN